MLVLHEFFVLHQWSFFLGHLNWGFGRNARASEVLPDGRVRTLVRLHLVDVFVKLNWVVGWISFSRRWPMVPILHVDHLNINFIFIFSTQKTNFERIFNNAILHSSILRLLPVCILSFIDIQRQVPLPLRLRLPFRHFTITVILWKVFSFFKLNVNYIIINY